MRANVRELFDLGFFEGDVLARYWIVLAEADLVGRRPGVLFCYVEEPRTRSAEEFDLLCNRLCHWVAQPCDDSFAMLRAGAL